MLFKKVTKLDIDCCDICSNYRECEYGCGYAYDRRGGERDEPLMSLDICCRDAECLHQRCPVRAPGFVRMSKEELICNAI